MRWEDERYVRFYTRNTPEWLALSWQARGLFGLIIREVDRAGILKLGKTGLRGVAVMLHTSWVEIETPLRELIDDGCIVISDDSKALIVPNFIEAQEAPQSDAARKRKSREMARATFPARSDETIASLKALENVDVTNRDHIQSQNVTKSHDESRPVTSGHSVPICADPCLAVPTRSEGTRPKVDSKKLQQAWLEATGNIGTGALSDLAMRCEEHAPLIGVDPTDYAIRFCAKFAEWVASCPPGKQPSLSPLKALEHFERIHDMLAGKRQIEPQAVAVESKRPQPKPYVKKYADGEA